MRHLCGVFGAEVVGTSTARGGGGRFCPKFRCAKVIGSGASALPELRKEDQLCISG